MMQGDAYKLPFRIKQGETVVTLEMVDDVEIIIGTLRKSLTGGEITCADGLWQYPLTQAETFSLSGVYQKVQVRVKFKGGDTVGVRLMDIDVDISLSREVL